MKFLRFSLLVSMFSLMASVIESANVIFLGLPLFSHLTSKTRVARELQKLGHGCYFPVTEELKTVLGVTEGVRYLPLETRFPEAFRVPGASAEIQNKKKKERKLMGLLDMYAEVCDDLLLDKDLFQLFKSVNASLFVIDGVFMSNCMAIFPFRLSTPFILMSSQNQPNLHRTPWLFSVFPHRYNVYSDRMSFFERLTNAMSLLLIYFRKPLGTPIRSVKEYAPEKPDISFDTLLRKADLHIIENDVLLDYPLATLPNVKYIGGIYTRPAQPLTGDLGRFANASEHGIVVVSFGSVLNSIHGSHVNNLEEAFKRIRYHVIWKRTSPSSFSAPNVFIRKWLPQNDILGHDKVKLFITHCGNGGQYESLYHGVPMIGFPTWGDQAFNARRMQEKGFGISMDIHHYTADELVRNINEVIENPKYKSNIQQASAIMKSSPEHPSARAARHIDHVIKFGGGHLRSYCQDIPLYQYMMLDVLAVTLFALHLSVFITIFILRKLLCLFYRKKSKSD